MKKLFTISALVVSLSGCQAMGGYMALHATAITQAGVVLGAVATGENVYIDTLTIKNDAQAK